MDDNTATNQPMQDVTSRLETALFESDEVKQPEQISESEAQNDVLEEELPDGDDSVSESENGEESDDLTLASYLGIDEDRLIINDDGSVSVSAIIDGASKAVDLKELVASYQMQGHVNNKSMALENQRKEFERDRSEVNKHMQSKVAELNSLGKMMEDELVSEYNNVDWDRLRSESPSDWAAFRQEFAERAQKVQRAKSAASQELKNLFDEQAGKQEAIQQRIIQEQRNLMLSENPQWSNPETLKKDQESMRVFLDEAYGFSAEELSGISDYRLIKVIRDVQAFRQGKKNATDNLQKTLPKFKKSGIAAKASTDMSKARAAKNKRAALRSSGSTSDAASILLDRM